MRIIIKKEVIHISLLQDFFNITRSYKKIAEGLYEIIIHLINVFNLIYAAETKDTGCNLRSGFLYVFETYTIQKILD